MIKEFSIRCKRLIENKSRLSKPLMVAKLRIDATASVAPMKVWPKIELRLELVKYCQRDDLKSVSAQSFVEES
jgi:hypothetical protein